MGSPVLTKARNLFDAGISSPNDIDTDEIISLLQNIEQIDDEVDRREVWNSSLKLLELSSTHCETVSIDEKLWQILIDQPDFPDEQIADVLFNFSEENALEVSLRESELLDFIRHVNSDPACAQLVSVFEEDILANSGDYVTEIDTRFDPSESNHSIGCLHILKQIAEHSPDIVIPLAPRLTHALSSTQPVRINELSYDILSILCTERPGDLETILPELFPYVANDEHTYCSEISELILELFPHATDAMKKTCMILYGNEPPVSSSEEPIELNHDAKVASESREIILDQIIRAVDEVHGTRRQRNNIVKDYISEQSNMLREARQVSTPVPVCRERARQLHSITEYYVVDRSNFDSIKTELEKLISSLEMMTTDGELDDDINDRIKRISNQIEQVYEIGPIIETRE